VEYNWRFKTSSKNHSTRSSYTFPDKEVEDIKQRLAESLLNKDLSEDLSETRSITFQFNDDLLAAESVNGCITSFDLESGSTIHLAKQILNDWKFSIHINDDGTDANGIPYISKSTDSDAIKAQQILREAIDQLKDPDASSIDKFREDKEISTLSMVLARHQIRKEQRRSKQVQKMTEKRLKEHHLLKKDQEKENLRKMNMMNLSTAIDRKTQKIDDLTFKENDVIKEVDLLKKCILTEAQERIFKQEEEKRLQAEMDERRRHLIEITQQKKQEMVVKIEKLFSAIDSVISYIHFQDKTRVMNILKTKVRMTRQKIAKFQRKKTWRDLSKWFHSWKTQNICKVERRCAMEELELAKREKRNEEVCRTHYAKVIKRKLLQQWHIYTQKQSN
jgi:hypothetical protein